MDSVHTPVKARIKNGSKAATRVEAASNVMKPGLESPFWNRVFPWTATTATLGSALATADATMEVIHFGLWHSHCDAEKTVLARYADSDKQEQQHEQQLKLKPKHDSAHSHLMLPNGPPLVSPTASDSTQLQLLMQMSKSPSTLTLDTLTTDAFVGVADVSTDLLSSDIFLESHDGNSLSPLKNDVENREVNVTPPQQNSDIHLEDHSDQKDILDAIAQETRKIALESVGKSPTFKLEEKVLLQPGPGSSRGSPTPNRSNSGMFDLLSGVGMPSPMATRRASEGALSPGLIFFKGVNGSGSNTPMMSSGRIGHLMHPAQQPQPSQQLPAKYAPIVSQQQQQQQQKELLVRFDSPVNSLRTRASTPTLGSAAARFQTFANTGSLAGTPRARSGMMSEANSRQFGGIQSSQPPLLQPQATLPPTTSMYELHSVFSTPNSFPKYSERDIAAIRMEITLKFEKEFELAQLEIQDLERQRNQALDGTRKIQGTLKEWEAFMKEMIAKKEADDSRTRQETAQLRLALEKSNAERDARAKELEDMSTRARQLRFDIEDERDASKKALLALQQDGDDRVRLIEDRYEVLKAHAEEKLQEANIEIARVRAGLEKEIAALRVKISRSELHVASLEKTVESKVAENAELTKICDDLLMQIENATGN
ncbi:Transforming acidic coiled-coil-containing protein 3 [Chytriomyces hyalinus]|nr:Transforming acidic coiled-coil-containing protein 3 [Chytriomyces hyalinus]